MRRRAGRILSDISKRESEFNRIMDIQTRDSEKIVQYKKLGPEIYEIEIISRVGSFFKGDGVIG